MSTWTPLDQPLDYFKLAGRKSPGVAVLLGSAPPANWDERKGYGLSGATVVFTGLGLAAFDIELTLTTAEDWEDWHSFKSILELPKPGRIPKAMDIWHPLLEEHGVKSVVLKGQTLPAEAEPGVYKIKLTFLQYRRPKLSLAKPEGSKASEKDPVDQYIEDLTSQVQDLSS